jgi:hypothetical protein
VRARRSEVCRAKVKHSDAKRRLSRDRSPAIRLYPSAPPHGTLVTARIPGDSDQQGQQADHRRATEEHTPIPRVEAKEPAIANAPEGSHKYPLRQFAHRTLSPPSFVAFQIGRAVWFSGLLVRAILAVSHCPIPDICGRRGLIQEPTTCSWNSKKNMSHLSACRCGAGQ